MAKSGGKGILLGVGVVAVAGIAFLTVNGRGGPKEGVEGAIGAAEQHQLEKTRYYEEWNEGEGALRTDEIEALGKIAAKFESAPAEAEKMLEKHGWSKAEYEEMIKAIRSNDELNRVFLAAKN